MQRIIIRERHRSPHLWCPAPSCHLRDISQSVHEKTERFSRPARLMLVRWLLLCRSGPLSAFLFIQLRTDTFGHKPITVKRQKRPFTTAFLLPVRCLPFLYSLFSLIKLEFHCAKNYYPRKAPFSAFVVSSSKLPPSRHKPISP
ncbi:hypothetical protein JOC77_001760 [Peribacillus deserti]|uniref:Uncharacterized protein n=1 Tax=Peribacillus deserti TaxID=673318 RepID=A0ABS2QGN0_9BACI|nr:hypothetical protein [Peribacillus deserti]